MTSERGDQPGTADDRVIVIGMPTFRRPTELARVLPRLIEQARQLRTARVRVIVVDNDPEGSARPQVEALASTDLLYVHERRPGISAARNRAIDAAGDADAIVFIDDDEVPDPGWLHALVASWKDWNCAGVTGPVTSVFEGPADDWVRGSGMFDRTVRPTGSVNPGASSANLLLDLSVLRRHGIVFDEEFGLSGGSDTMLAHRLRERGEQIRWCQEAGVTEYVPAGRSQRQHVEPGGLEAGRRTRTDSPCLRHLDRSRGLSHWPGIRSPSRREGPA